MVKIMFLDLLCVQISKNKPEHQGKCRWSWLVAYAANDS